jgi:hypothetical protein
MKRVEVVDEQSLVCNKCGQKIKQEAYELALATSCNVEKITQLECCPVVVHWGYWSKDKDTQKHEWELCEGCYDALVATFVIPPKITHYM